MNRSPALTILLMIIITTPTIYVTHVWVGTCMSTTFTHLEHAILIQSVAFNSNTDEIIIYVQNVGLGSVGITNVHLNGVRHTITAPDPLAEGESAPIRSTPDYVLGETINIKLTCADGTFTETTVTVT